MRGKLYLVGTPIGNLGDITLRALETLKTVDVVACEDTRHTLALLNKFEIRKPLISYYKQKEKAGSEAIVELLDEGKNVALVTDAGMPCISDPGSVLVKNLLERGYDYSVVPGVSAVTSAAALVGTENGFAFIGFLPEKNKDKDRVIEEIRGLRRSVLLYAAPHDVNKVLEYLYEKLGDRKVFVVKEITKVFEKVTAGTLKDTRVDNPKGEFVLVVEPEERRQTELTDEEIKEILSEEMANGKDAKTAVASVTDKHSLPKNRVYKISLTMK